MPKVSRKSKKFNRSVVTGIRGSASILFIRKTQHKYNLLVFYFIKKDESNADRVLKKKKRLISSCNCCFSAVFVIITVPPKIN